VIRLLPLAGALLFTACSGYEPVIGDPVCPDLLVCPEPVQASCTGPDTPVEVADAAVCERTTATDDRQASYPLGDSVVTFQARIDGLGVSNSATCQTPVTVVDDSAPVVTCDETVDVVRTAPDQELPEPPVGTADDLCDPDSVTLEVSPSQLEAPSTTVTTTATDGAGNQASCSTQVQIVDLFPASDLRVLGAELDGEETRVTLGWAAPASEDVAVLELQRADSPDGPWTEVAAADPADLTVTTTVSASGWYRLLSTRGSLEGGATEPLRVHRIQDDGYNLSEQRVPGVPFATSLYGVVRAPVQLDEGPYPLVLLLHGNHGNCRRRGTRNDYCAELTTHECPYDGYYAAPNAEGMAFQAETLAAQGMVAVSISANALNCRGGYILERAQLLGEHLRRWKAWNDGQASPLSLDVTGAVDLSRTGLVGHSRGGDAVSHVPQLLLDTPIDGVDVVSIFAIAPTDYNDATVLDASWALLLPACDGDVSNLWGSDIYERSTDQVGADVWHKSQVFMAGANHNYFSTEWAYDDGQRVCPRSAMVGLDAQTSMLEATLGSWMVRTLDEDVPEPYHRAEQGMPGSVRTHIPTAVDLRWSYTESGATRVEAFDDDPLVNALGGSNTAEDFVEARACEHSDCGSAFLHRTTALATSWDGAAAPGLIVDLASTDTSAYDSVSFRVVSRVSKRNNGRGNQPYQLVFTDADGRQVTLDEQDLTAVPHAYSSYNVREVLQTVRVPFNRLTAVEPDFALDAIASVRVELGTDGQPGAVTLTDVELGY